MITTITGTNTFLVQSEVRKQTGAFVEEHGELALERYDGQEASYEQLVEALQNLPFLASQKMVVIKNPDANKQFAEQFADLVPTIGETTDVLLIEPKPDKRTAFYKALKKHTQFQELQELDGRQLAKWLADEAKNRGGNLSMADAAYMVGRLGTNQMILANELDKLLLYDPRITRKNIESLTEPAPQSSIFELLGAAFQGNLREVEKMYKEQRAQKVEPQQIIAMLAWQLHVLAVIKTAGDRRPDQIAKEAKINPFALRRSGALLRGKSLADVKRMVKEALALDVRIKSENIDADDALRHFLLTIAQ